MSKRRKPDEEEEDELDALAPPAKVARKMSVDELVEAVTAETDETVLGQVVLELFENVIETWSVQDWLAFTRITASWSGLRHPEVVKTYIHVWRGLVLRDFYCSVRGGLYRFIRNIEWLWQRKRNLTKPYPRPSLRDFWRRAYFAANKYLHYLLGVGIGLLLYHAKLRPAAPPGRLDVPLPPPGIIPDDFRPWIEDPAEIVRNRVADDEIDDNLMGLPSMALAPHTADLSALFVSSLREVWTGSVAVANTTAFTKWTRSRYHAFPVRLATRGLPDRFVVIPTSLTTSSIVLLERIEPEFHEDRPDLRLAYAMEGLARVTSDDVDARADVALELTAERDALTDLFLAGPAELPRYLIGRAAAIAEYHVPGRREDHRHTVKTSLGLNAVDAELFAMGALHLVQFNLEAMPPELNLRTDRDMLLVSLATTEYQESQGISRMRYRPFDWGHYTVPLEGLGTSQLDGWPLFLQLCLTEDPAELRARPPRSPSRGYFNTLTRLFRTPPVDQDHLDPFLTMPERQRGVIVGPPKFILFDCGICGATPATKCCLDQPTRRYCQECAVKRTNVINHSTFVNY